MTVVGAAALAASVAFFGSTAQADDAAAARFHDRRAREHYAEGRYEEAAREFFLEQRIAPNPRVVFNIAVCLQLLGRSADAFQMFTEYLAGDDDNDEREARARAAVEELSPLVARLAVTTSPRGARIFVDQREYGAYGRSPSVVAVDPGDHRLYLELEGHRTAEVDVSVTQGEQVDLEVSLEAITGRVEIRSSTPGRAELRTPGGALEAEGETPLTVSLPPGPYEVVVTAEGYQTHRGLVEARADAVARHRAELSVLPRARGTLTVTSNHPGALVTVDDTPAGFTPLVLEDVEVGERSVRVERAGLDPWSGEVRVVAESPTWLTLTLQNQQPESVHSPVTWVLGATGIAAVAVGAVVGGFALDHRLGFEAARESELVNIGEYRQHGELLSATTDVLLAVGATALVAAVVLFVLEEVEPHPHSSASSSRGETPNAPRGPRR